MAGDILRRWILPAGTIVLVGVLGAAAIALRGSGPPPLLGPKPPETASAPPPSPPPEKEAPFTVLFGGECGGRLWSPPCSKFGLGGLERLAALVRAGAGRPDAALALDTGDLAGAPGEAGAEEVGFGLKALRIAGVHAAAVGERDLLAGLDRWRHRKNENGEGLAVLCANLRDDEGLPLVPGAAEFRFGKRRILVAAILSPSFEPGLRAAGVPVRLLPPVEALRKDLAAAGPADLVVLLSHAPPEESREIAKALPEVRLVITAHAGPHPWLEPESVGGRTLMAPGSGWQYLASALFLGKPGEGIDLLDARTAAAGKSVIPEPGAGIVAEEAKFTWRQEGYLWRILEADAARAPEGAPAYAGPAACASCHPAAHAKWREEPHARSAARLVKGNFDTVPLCLSCHATAPGRPGGHARPKDDQASVSCEACHGPGKEHVAQDGRSPLPDAKASCGACHTPEMSPGFRYEDAWPRIVHGR